MGAQGALNQPSFAAGELSPSLYGRTDLAKYRAGAQELRNFFVMPYGGAATRPGTAIVGRCKQAYGTKPRNIDFQYNTLQAYILEFGNLYMRVIKDGGYVLEPSKTVTAATAANPAVFTRAAHGYLAGDWLYPAGFTGAGWEDLNGTPGYAWIVATVPTVDTFTVTDLDGNVVSTAGFIAYPGGGTVSRFFTLVTPYAAADLPLLKYVQSADVMTLTHPSYAPRNLTRSSHYAWTLSTITFAAAVQVPASIVVAAVGGGAVLDFYYVATALVDSTGEESVPTAAGTVTNASLNQFTGVNNRITLTVPGSGPAPSRYNIYKANAVATGEPAPTVFGYIGQTTSLTFVDTNIEPDFTVGPPAQVNPFASNNHPACSTYNQGRQWYGGSTTLPQTMWATRADNFTNMDVHSPVQADDAITVTLVSRQVNAIKHLVSTTALLAMTSGGAWLVDAGGQSDAITPTSIRAKPQSFNGCSDVPPLTVADTILYVQYLGTKPRGIGYDFYQNIFRGNDLSVLSNHLFAGYTVQEWTYCEEPNYQVLAVRDDGAALAFTFLKEQDVYAWSRYETLGDSGEDKYVSIASIPESGENTPYFIVARTIPGVNSGNPVYYQERQASRDFYVDGVADVREAWCVDSGRQYVGTGQTELTGLQHLEGAEVSLLVNGSTQAPREVVDGAITLDAPLETGQIATIGLPYVCDLTTLRIDMGSMAGKRKKISRLNLTVQASRGLSISPARQKANGDIVFDQFVEIKERTNQPYADPVELITGVETLLIKPQWQVEGQVKIRQAYPLPATVLALTPWIEIGDDGG